MRSNLRKKQHWKLGIIGMAVVCLLFTGIGIYGTYQASPASREFYIYYMMLTVSSIIMGNIITPLLQKPASELLVEETNEHIGKMGGQIDETNMKIDSLYKLLSATQNLGIFDITMEPPDIDWPSLIAGSAEIRLAFKSDVKWLTTNKTHLANLLCNPKAKIKVILPDTSIDHLCSQLAVQKKQSTENIKGDVENAIAILKELNSSAPNRVFCKISNTIFVSHFYIFSTKAIVTIRTVNRWRSPHIICDNSVPGRNAMYEFCRSQFEEFWIGRSTEVDLTEGAQVVPVTEEGDNALS